MTSLEARMKFRASQHAPTQALAVLYAELDEALDDIDAQYQLSSTDDPELQALVLKAAAIVTKIQEQNGHDRAVTTESVTTKVTEGPADMGPAAVSDAAGSE